MKLVINIIVLVVLMSSCNSTLESDFSKESENLKTEWGIQQHKFIESHYKEFSDKQMLKSMDSITELYCVTKNKQLAVKFVKCKSGIKRLNFLKTYFQKSQIQALLKTVPPSLKNDTN